MKKLILAGMCLWEVEIDYQGWTSREQRTLTIATRRRTMKEAQKKAASYLRSFRYDYPKARIEGIRYRGFIDA